MDAGGRERAGARPAARDGSLPLNDFRAAVEAIASEVPQRELTAAFDRIAASYSGDARRTSATSRTDAIAYALGRGFGTFAAVEHALRAIALVRPSWRPTSLLDLGAGTGSASWAAVSVFGSIEKVTSIERSDAMASLGQRLSISGPPPLRNASWIRGDVAHPTDEARSDLAIASFVLGELPLEERDEAIARWFDLTEDELVVVEPGSVGGFEVIRAARGRLIASGGTISAPCPHDGTCPMTEGDWCHFGIRVPRSRLQRGITSGDRGFEDEKFSYVAASKRDVAERWPRVVRRPRQHGGHVRLDLCAKPGLVEIVVARSDRDRYRRSRKVEWGDAFGEAVP